jgi:hypothetical protein
LVLVNSLTRQLVNSLTCQLYQLYQPYQPYQLLPPIVDDFLHQTNKAIGTQFLPFYQKPMALDFDL